MFLTIVFKIAADKNADGQGYCRRRGEKVPKAARTITGLSCRKEKIISQAMTNFTTAYCALIRWGLANWPALPFSFPLSKDGVAVLDKNGRQKMGTTSAHYLANWLAKFAECPAVPLNARLSNGTRNQAAETLLSQYKLRQTAAERPSRLTGAVEFPELVTEAESSRRLAKLLRILQTRHLSEAELAKAKELLAEKSRLLPILFSGLADFPLFRHRRSGRLFVVLPLLAKEQAELQPLVKQKGASWLVTLRLDGEPVPNSRLWILLPLRRRPEAEQLLADPQVVPRTAELRLAKDGSYRFNVVVDVPEPEASQPESFMAVRFGYYRVDWRVTDREGSERERGEIDLAYLQPLIKAAAVRRSRAFSRWQTKRLPNYRGKLKLEREKTINQLIAVAQRHRAAIGAEDISGVNKSTGSSQANLFRSHWDFGRSVELLTYKSALAGLPLARRGRKKQLHLTSSFRTVFTHAPCGADEKAGVKVRDGKTICPVCQTADPVTDNALAVIGQRLAEYFRADR